MISRHWSPSQQHAEKRVSLIPPYDLRHQFGTRLADVGVDVVKIKELMGYALDHDNHDCRRSDSNRHECDLARF